MSFNSIYFYFTPLFMQLSIFKTEVDYKKYIIGIAPLYSHSGDDSNEDPPVPIPNTEVKLVYARCSWVLTPQDKVVAGFHKIMHPV